MAGRDNKHLEEANEAMDLTPQEGALYRRHLDNLWGEGGVDNDDGSRSTLYAYTGKFTPKEIEQAGMPSGMADKAFIIPSVKGGRIMSADEAFKNAVSEGVEKFPHYDNEDQALDRYMKLHDFMGKDTEDYQNQMEAGDTDYAGNKE